MPSLRPKLSDLPALRAPPTLSVLADLILPRQCPGCGDRCGPDSRDGARSLLCAPCGAPLRQLPGPAWPDPIPVGLPPPWATAAYETRVRAAIVAYKERGRWRLTRPLGRALAAAVQAAHEATPAGASGSGPLLAPVPVRQASVARRGYDPIGRLAVDAAAALRASGLPARVAPLLTHARSVADQAGLRADSRAANLSGVFTVPRGFQRWVRGRRVIVVDDVITTGATLAEAVRALRAYGAEVPCTGVVAATQRRAASKR